MMASWRDQKNGARLTLHKTFKVDGFYFAAKGTLGLPVTVRPHLRWDAVGQLKEVAGYAEVQSIKPKIVFLRSEVTPANNALVYLAADEIYRVSNVLPVDGITVTAEVVRLTAKQIADPWQDGSQLQFPEEV